MSKQRGRKPFGFYDDELVVVEQIFIKANRRPHGVKPTLKAISDSMNKDGHKTQKGGTWYPIAVGRILRKEGGIDYYRTLHDQPEPEPEPEKVEKTKPKKRAKPVTALTQEEIDMCRRFLIDSDRMLFEVLFGAGLRASECCALLVKDINIYTGNSYIAVRDGKGSKPRHVKVDSFLREKLTDYISYLRTLPEARYVTPPFELIPMFVNNRGKQLTYSNLYDRIKKLQRRAGIKNLHPHKLRHTFAAHLYHYTKHLEYVREQLGHATIAITQIYVNTLDISKLDMQEMFGRGTQTKP